MDRMSAELNVVQIARNNLNCHSRGNRRTLPQLWREYREVPQYSQGYSQCYGLHRAWKARRLPMIVDVQVARASG